MKKIGIFVLLFLLLMVSFVSAVSTTLEEGYDKKENILIEVKGNILSPINVGDVEFKRKNVGVPLDYGVLNLEDKHFIWAIAPDKNETYTLLINNLETTVNGQKQMINYTQNFIVFENLTDYSIKPGVITAKGDFEIEINSYVDSEIIIQVNFPYEDNLRIKPGNNKFTFLTDKIKEDLFTSIKIGKYSVPLSLDIDDKSSVSRKKGLYFEPVSIKREILSGERPVYLIKIKNAEDRNYQDVKIKYDKDLFFITPDGVFNIANEGNYNFNLTFKKAVDKNIKDQVEIIFDNSSIVLPVEITLSENAIPISANTSEGFQYFCSELAGVKCISGESCSGEEKEGLDGLCCLGVCQAVAVEEEGNTSEIIGYILALGIFLILGYLIYRFKKAKKEGNDEIAEKLGPSRLSKMKAAGMVEEKIERKDLP
ncbi:MAG: hypothetical protein Q7R87_04090 [Nanoarchaeota archaeon]|nr:hypothetical protein [Nanoarchaeota archaeon]